jgi:hypothetical protein
MRRPGSILLLLLFWTGVAAAFDLSPREFNVDLSSGKSPMNFHGRSVFRSIHFEVAGESALARRWLHADAGASISYSDIRQARSWFGYRYGDPDDSVRAVSTFFFVRRYWNWMYAELGTGPMWSNRRVPAATSRFNMDSQFGLGAVLFPASHLPLRAGYRFSHISNGGWTGRNPGLNVHSIIVGARVMRLR